MGGVQTLSRDSEKPGSSSQILNGARTDTELSATKRKLVLGKELTRLSATVEEGRKKRRTVSQYRDTLL
jgi:hypothetical protein